ncbi:MAG: hypothetical protein K2O42_01520 [Oscillospiraceae bacterium]|nr:hypothetical protein [Oscillospiraceae bacterium]
MDIITLVAAEGADASWSLSNLISDIPTLFSSVGNMIMANPVASIFVGISLIGGGVGLFRKVIHVR